MKTIELIDEAIVRMEKGATVISIETGKEFSPNMRKEVYNYLNGAPDDIKMKRRNDGKLVIFFNGKSHTLIGLTPVEKKTETLNWIVGNSHKLDAERPSIWDAEIVTRALGFIAGQIAYFDDLPLIAAAYNKDIQEIAQDHRPDNFDILSSAIPRARQEAMDDGELEELIRIFSEEFNRGVRAQADNNEDPSLK